MCRVKENLGIVINPKANPRTINWAERSFPQTEYPRVDPFHPHGTIPETIIVVGGDGTLLPVVRLVHARDTTHTLIAAGGGTAEMIHGSLIHAKQTISERELMDQAIPTDARQMRVGEANGRIFTFLAGFGSNETRYPEILRNLFLPQSLRRIKPYVATWKNFMSHLKNRDEQEHIIDMILTGSHVGGRKPILDDNIFGPRLEYVRVKGSSFQVMAHIGLAFVYYSRFHRFPDWFKGDIRHADSFTVKRHGDIVNFDGEDEPVDRNEAIVVKKSEKPITIFALKRTA